MQKVLIFEKKKLLTSWIRTRDLLNASQLFYAAECNLITAFTRGDKLEVGG